MYKLVVLCAFFAIAAAKPDVLLTAPVTGYTTYVAPASTTITKQASSVIHPSPILYNTPLAYTHLIKKRSPQLPLTYFAPTNYLSTSPLATTYTTPFVHGAPILPAATLPIAAAHLIKKRAAPVLPTTFITPATYTATSPIVASTYSSPLISTPLINSAPLISHPYAYTTHFIKKRSAPILNTYLAPTSYSHQSRIDLHSTPLITSYTSPLAYTAPIATVSHVF
ncbi:hypothetical protein O3G_MSEX002191 [Manduca sexta]|uniref:Cuticle protein n=1 Tax=Manduca sexta TaxID=7130 RepID=A0A922CDI1_MANSE|nr:hypothetical protein O3G_MSEX002191 [Manduca sexta]KAG6442266.1 hypothetical protein O3G_MSEX002191 [Manduca sexta]